VKKNLLLSVLASLREANFSFFLAPRRKDAKGAVANPRRHPELVSGSMPNGQPVSQIAAWMLKQVQHDGCELEAAE
jgi:hypothetical protein